MLSFVTNAMNFFLVSEGKFMWNGKAIDNKFKYLKTLSDSLNVILWPLLIIVAVVATIYAIYLGINMAKADDSTKREQAKSKFFNVIIAAVVTIVLILVVQLVVIPTIPSWLEL